MTEKVVSPKIYIWTCVALLVLLAVTWSIAYVNLGPFNTKATSSRYSSCRSREAAGFCIWLRSLA